jgi:hypothetical protein
MAATEFADRSAIPSVHQISKRTHDDSVANTNTQFSRAVVERNYSVYGTSALRIHTRLLSSSTCRWHGCYLAKHHRRYGFLCLTITREISLVFRLCSLVCTALVFELEISLDFAAGWVVLTQNVVTLSTW